MTSAAGGCEAGANACASPVGSVLCAAGTGAAVGVAVGAAVGGGAQPCKEVHLERKASLHMEVINGDNPGPLGWTQLTAFQGVS